MTFQDLKDLFRNYQKKGVHIRLTYQGMSVSRKYHYKVYTIRIPWKDLVNLNIDELLDAVDSYATDRLGG